MDDVDDMDSTEHAKTGPANPEPEGVEVPTAPGGPQRVDEPDTDEIPGREAAGNDEGGDTTDPAPRDVVEENAETSLDQPSGDVS